MKGSIAAINQEARERGMSYGKYLAFRAAQEVSASGREGKTTAKPKWSMPPGASLAGREGKTTAKPKRSMPPGASLGLAEAGQEWAAKRGHALRQARLRAGLSLEQAARRIDVTASAVRQWETGKKRPKPQSQRKIAQAYGLEPAELERMLEARP